MTLVHAEISENGEFFFRAESVNVEDGVGRALVGPALVDALGPVLARPEEASLDTDERLTPGR